MCDLTCIIGLLNLIVLIFGVYFAYIIGKRQNEINENLVKINDFVELFVIPNNSNKLVIINVGNYPVYLKKIIFNDTIKILDNAILPCNSNNCYSLSIPPYIKEKKDFELSISYEDYLNRNYISKAKGFLNEKSEWKIITSKKDKLD
jgi:hypothetical protein